MTAYLPRMCTIAGTYRIQVGPTFYIGSTTHLGSRLSDHRTRLVAGTHPNTALQAAYAEHGTFEAFLLKEIPRKEDDSDHYHSRRLLFHEQIELDQHFGTPGCANASSQSGFNHKAGAHLKVLWQDPEWRAARIKEMKQREVTQETRRKLAAAKTGAANHKARSCTLIFEGETMRFDSCRNAAAHFKVTAQAMDNWLSGASPWPGEGTRKPRPQNRRLIGLTGFYDDSSQVDATRRAVDTTAIKRNPKPRVFKALRQ